MGTYQVNVLALSTMFHAITVFCNGNATVSRESDPGIFLNGTFIIGGLFPVHYASTNITTSAKCNGKFNLEGFLNMEAMLYAVHEINKDNHLLPGVRLGVNIEDTCSCVDNAIRKSLNFSFIKSNIRNPDCPAKESSTSPTIAIIGPGSSDIAMAVTNLAGLFYVPVVSFSASSRLLSNRIRFKYFLRTVSSDSQMAMAIVHLLQALRWNFVSALYSDTDYGRSAMETFDDVRKSLPAADKICLAVKRSFTIHSKKKKLEEILEAVKAKPNAKAVLLFTTVEDAKLILAEFEDHRMTEYVFIGTDYLVGDLESVHLSHKMLLRLVGVTPKIQSQLTPKRYFDNHIRNGIHAHVWLDEYRQYKLRPLGNNKVNRRPPPYIPYLLDAVYAVAHGLHHVLGCTPKRGCKVAPAEFTRINRDGHRLLKAIQSVKFRGFSREWVFFDSNGNSLGAYDITVLNEYSEQFEPIGSWISNTSNESISPSNSSFLDLNVTHLREHWNRALHSTDQELESVCGKKCHPGYRMASTNEHQECCWVCVPCAENEVSHTTVNRSCRKCPEHYWANQNHTQCEPVVLTAVQFSDTLGVIVTSVGSVGILVVIFVSAVFYMYWDSHVVRASSRLLSCVLLFGIALGYTTAILIFSRKTETVCRVVLYLVSISFSLLVGTLLTKTNRIHRIFSKKAMRKGTPKCLSDQWMLLFISFLVGVEVVICTIIVLTTADGKLQEILYIKHANQGFLQCKFYATYADYHMAMWWTYNSGIVLVCTYQAYLTRKVPGNYNEARFIAFNMMTITTDVIVFFLSYYGTRGFYKDILVSYFLLLADTVTLGCIFVPKVYIILFRPEKNVAHGKTSLGTIDDNIRLELRKVSHVSQRSNVSMLSSSSNGTNTETANQNCAKVLKRKRKLSVFCKDGFNLASETSIATDVESDCDEHVHSEQGSRYTFLDGAPSPELKHRQMKQSWTKNKELPVRSKNSSILRLALEQNANELSHTRPIAPLPLERGNSNFDSKQNFAGVLQTARPSVSRMSSDMSTRSVHFEDELVPTCEVVFDDFNPANQPGLVYRRRLSTI